MVNNRAQPQAGNGVWVCGLSMADFEIPSKPTAIAKAAQIVASVTLDLADATTSGGEDGIASGDLQPEVLDLTALDGWASVEQDDAEDYADRKVGWPLLDPQDFAPAKAVQERIENNIAAIELARELGEQGRTPTPDDMAQLLRYCGWGGAARVFSPDGAKPQPLAPLRDRLMAISTDAEYAAMQSSVNTSFYTPPQLVEAIWRIAQHLGFKGGRVVEPAAGVGHVLAGMPSGLARKSMVTAVEKDLCSAAILERAFAPYGVQVHACGLEEARLPHGFFDLAIGNAPFGAFRTNDTSASPYADWMIHNWFLGKSIELVRPGGLVVMITTRGSLDSKTDAHRRWLSAHAEMVAAIRLPTMAFKEHANTEAVTDIVVFQRREIPDFAAKPNWAAAEPARAELFARGEPVKTTGRNQAGYSYPVEELVNAHFNRHPEMVVGQLKWSSTQHGPAALPEFNGDLDRVAERVQQLVATLPADLYRPAKAEVALNVTAPMARYANLDRALPGSFVEYQGRICISEGEELVDVDTLYSGTARKRLLGMLEIRNAALGVIEHQAASEDDVELKRLQGLLNRNYDTFVSQLGALSIAANSRVMRSDPTWPVLLALEIYDEDTDTVTKADIFTQRTVGIPEVPQKVDSVKDALLLSLSLFGRIDLGDMSKRCGRAVREVIDQLRAEALAYRDPVKGAWVPADEYLSGNIRDKIAEAKAAGGDYLLNVPALEAVIPQDLGPAEVEARLGAPWVPCDVVKQFATELVNDTRGSIDVSFEQTTATWTVKATMGSVEWVGDRSLQSVKWGTSYRCALTLLEAALNQQPPTITKTVDERTVVDAQATFAAREKWQAIRDEFRMWVYRDDARRDRLLRIYNDTFNQLVPRVFDGRHLRLPGMSRVVTPYEHQLSAIWRILVTGNTLLAHCVGAGKTLTMAAASMELRRLGKARKPCHVVPNNCLSQYSGEFVRLYPQARVLMATKEDLSGDRRRTFVARIATGDWDAVVMTQATFERLMLSPGKQQAFIDRMLDEARTMMALTEDRGAKRSIKELERRMKEYEAKIKRLVEKGDDESSVWFDDLGVDWVFIDEAHSLKNLGRMSKMPRIAGLPNVASQRAFDAFMKTRLIMEARGNKEEGVVYASATPISNSLGELHTMQIYLQPQTLKRYGLYEFDAWSASFGEAVTGIELAPDGSGFRTNTRYCRFVNLSELMTIFKGVADIRTKRMLNLPTPRLEGGKPQVMVVEASDKLKSIVADLVERADAIRNRKVSPDEDNMLSITNDGRRAALDVRLFDPSLPADPAGKLAKAAGNIYRIWNAGMSQRHTQLVFSDLGTPGANGFSVYEEMRRLLIELGIPENEIAFVQDYDSDNAKAKLFKKVRDGAVRVLLGSTPKMGTGTNVQKRLKSVHSLDVPWRPADLEQRDGRADRQGNECESIELWRYVTQGSFDAYSYNLLDVKARFIEQVMTAEKGLRSVEDISITALSYAELKAVASGNPLVLEKAGVDAKVQKLSLAYDHWEQDRWRFGSRKAALANRLAWINQAMPAVEKDAALAEQLAQTGWEVKPVGATATAASVGATSAAESIGLAFRACSAAKREGEFADVGGFTLKVLRGYMAVELEVCTPYSGLSAKVERPNMNDVVGVGNAALATIGAIARDPAKLREEFGRKTDELASIEKMLTEDFEQREELMKARARQAEIEALLDLDKSTAGTQAMETETA